MLAGFREHGLGRSRFVAPNLGSEHVSLFELPQLFFAVTGASDPLRERPKAKAEESSGATEAEGPFLCWVPL